MNTFILCFIGTDGMQYCRTYHLGEAWRKEVVGDVADVTPLPRETAFRLIQSAKDRADITNQLYSTRLHSTCCLTVLPH